jgi:hypothetical protein
MMTADEILTSAPVSKKLGMKLAFLCSGCPWWTHSWEIPHLDEAGQLCCLACGSPLRYLPLEVLLVTTREENPHHFQGFLEAFSENRPNPGVTPKET